MASTSWDLDKNNRGYNQQLILRQQCNKLNNGTKLRCELKVVGTNGTTSTTIGMWPAMESDAFVDDLSTHHGRGFQCYVRLSEATTNNGIGARGVRIGDKKLYVGYRMGPPRYVCWFINHYNLH